MTPNWDHIVALALGVSIAAVVINSYRAVFPLRKILAVMERRS